jgi:2-polyprenyl-6-hydroxyphenyl methylase/3-demethylubiquinone-9 3-methyltransferase
MTTSASTLDSATPDLREQYARDVARGERFEFGRNWARFLALLDEDRITRAERSLQAFLGRDSFAGLRFLDIGSGSGLFSLAARRLGATVHSFDYDPYSVACTTELRRRYRPSDPAWTVEQGSALDERYVASLGTFDIVYSWGVLHHTGAMWKALDIAQRAVAPGGQLFIAIYNDTGSQTARWAAIKRTYVGLPRPLRLPFMLAVYAPAELKELAKACLRLNPAAYVRTWTDYRQRRGMSKWRDLVDWIGGYPYEAARVDAVFDFLRARGYRLDRVRCGGGIGCNEYLFVRST